MSYRPYAAQRSYSGHNYSPADGENSHFVNDNSHVNSIPYHPPYTPPPHLHPRQHFPYYQNHQFYPQPLNNQYQYQPPRQQFYQNHQFYAPMQPLNNQQFRPTQQYHPRPTTPSDYRRWEYAIPEPPPHCERFTILSYNLLADYLATKGHGQLYHHIPRQFMDWQWRKRSIDFELGLWSADILCFQEVDKFQELEELLKPRGYTGIWKMRTGDPVDGCAIFWRTSRFKLLYEESIEFNKYGLRDNVAQICVMESTGCIGNNYESASTTSSRQYNKVIVCNTHVLFNPKRGDIKLGQVRELFHRADAVAKLWNEVPVIFCGDFNCTPKSPLYSFIEEQKLDLSGLPRNRVSGQLSEHTAPQIPSNNHGVQLSEHTDPYVWTAEEMRTATSDAECKVIVHPIKLKSTYTEVKHDNSGTRDSSGEPLVTAYNQRFQGTVDYIWRSEGLQTVRVLTPLPKSAMACTQGFPTKKWGSDHIALVSELAFVKNCSTKDMDS